MGWIDRIRNWRPELSPVWLGEATVIAMAVLQVVGVPLVDRLGLAVFDTYQRAAPRPYEDVPVRIVDIDDESIRRLGQWPWPREQPCIFRTGCERGRCRHGGPSRSTQDYRCHRHDVRVPVRIG